MAGAPASWDAGWKGFFDQLRSRENTLTDLSIYGRATRLAKIPEDVELSVTASSASAGTTKLGKLELGAKLHQQAVSLSASLASPEPSASPWLGTWTTTGRD